MISVVVVTAIFFALAYSSSITFEGKSEYSHTEFSIQVIDVQKQKKKRQESKCCPEELAIQWQNDVDQGKWEILYSFLF